MCQITLLLSGILDIQKKYGDICQFMRDTCLFTSRNIVTSPLPPSKQATSHYNTWVFCERNSSYSHSVVVDSLFNQCSSHLLILRLWFLLCYVYLCALSSFANILTRKMEMAAYLVVLPMSKLWSVALSNVTVGWSAL